MIGSDWRLLAAFAANLQPAPPPLSCRPIRFFACFCKEFAGDRASDP
jgi:hypothetical protein